MFTIPTNAYLRRLSIALMVSITIIIALEALARMVFFLTSPEFSHSSQFDQKLWIAQHPTQQEKEEQSIVMLGNSQIKYAFFPEQLELQTAKNIVNLGSDAASPRMNLYLLKEAVQSGYKPSEVVLNINALSFSKMHRTHPELSAEKTFSRSYPGQCIIQKPQHFADHIDCQLQKYSILYRYRSWLNKKRDDMGKAVIKPELIYQSRRYNVTATEFSPKGWAAGYKTYNSEHFTKTFSHPLLTDGEVGETLKEFQYEWDTQAVQKIIAYCKNNDLSLTLVWLPRHSLWFKAHPFFNLTLEDETKIISKIEDYANSHNIRFLDMHDMPLPDTHFYDTNHQNVLGAIQVGEAFMKQYQEVRR